VKKVVPNIAPVTVTATSASADLLGLDTSSTNQTNQTASVTTLPSAVQQKTENSISDTFDFFSDSTVSQPSQVQNNVAKNGNNDSLKQEEDDFFNQKSMENGAEKGKLTKDNILALYGNSSSSPFQAPTFNANFQQAPPPQQPPQDSFFNFGQQVPSAFKTQVPPQQPFIPVVGQATMMGNFNTNGNYGNFNSFGTMQSQQINRLNEENIRKIESLNFNNFK